MNKRTREIIALVLLVLLGGAVLAAMAWYILVGHNWNVAATTIDETVGKMDGYTVLLFEGKTLPENERTKISDSQPMLDDDNRGTSHARAHDEDASAEPLTTNMVAPYYRQKGATVFVLHPERPTDYAPPVIANKNGCYLGILYVDGSTTRASAQYKASVLEKLDVDFVVGVVDDARLIDEPAASIDILLCSTDEELSSKGEYHGSTFCVDSPYIGQVQALIIAPSNVITSKTISSL